MKEKEIQSRRKFIKTGTVAALGSPLIISSFSMQNSITGVEIEKHFQKIGKWMNWNQTTDTFKIGNPDKKVKKVVVSWKANLAAIEEAIAMNADLFISHESVCANADNSFMGPEIKFALPTELPKFKKIEKAGLAVYRCHDLWDAFPKIGIRDSWQKGLDIGENIIVDKYPAYVTQIEPLTVNDLAKHIIKQIKPLRQTGVLVSGNGNKIVSKVGTGTGVTTDPIALRELGADVGIMTDDYYKHVRLGEHARELDFPTIIVNHGVAEEWGIQNLAVYIQKEFPMLEVHHIPQYCPYQIITG